VVLVRDIIVRSFSVPGVGVPLEFGTLLVYAFDPQIGSALFSSVSRIVSSVGVLLYIVVGAIAISKGLENSVT